jgi:hypothetical protein
VSSSSSSSSAPSSCIGLRFNGGNYATASNSSGQFDLSTGTYEFWFRSTTSASDTRILATYNGTGGGWLIGFLNGNIRFFSNAIGQLDQSSSINVLDGEWHHIAVTLSGVNNAAKLWIDGGLEDTGTVAAAVTGGPLYFARATDEHYQAGDLRRARISSTVRYTDAFTPAMSYGADGALGFWRLNDNNESHTATDGSGNNNNATLYGDQNTQYPEWIFGDLPGDSSSSSLPSSSGQPSSCIGLRFNGANYGQASNSSGQFDLSTGTYELWFRATSPGSDTRMLATYDGTGGGWLIGVLNGKIRFFSNAIGQLDQTSTTDFLDGEWHHVAVTLAGGATR